MPKQVTFEMKGEGTARLTVASLIDLLERTLDWLRSLDPSLHAEWTPLRLKLTPPYRFTFENPSANGPVSSRLRDFHALSARRKRKDDLAQPRLSEGEVESTNRLAELIGENITEMRITSAGEPAFRINHDVAEKVKTIAKTMRSTMRREWTTIRGTLYEVTIAGGTRNFKVKHQLTGASIPCAFSEDITVWVKEALPSRVEVYGLARFNRLGQPIGIDVKLFRLLPKLDIAAEDLSGIQITGGVSSREYLEGVGRA